MTATNLQDRSFSCTFCHRKFTSAQALGGHMNLHRRERATLRTHFPPSIFSDPPVLFGHRFWALKQNPLVYNKLLFDPSTVNLVMHQDGVSSKLDCNTDHHHHILKSPYNKSRRQYGLIKKSQDNPMITGGGALDLELRLGLSLT